MVDFKDKKWIVLGKKKLMNPCIGSENAFCDLPELFEINKPKQIENFNNFRESIREFGNDIHYIYAKENGCEQFIGVSTDYRFCYYRYYPNASGAQNYVFINGNRLNLTTWLAKSINERAEIINTL